jgi:hypothetical protein
MEKFEPQLSMNLHRAQGKQPGGEAEVKSFRKELWFQPRERREFLNITPQVQQVLRESGIQEGLLLCNAMHITASLVNVVELLSG